MVDPESVDVEVPDVREVWGRLPLFFKEQTRAGTWKTTTTQRLEQQAQTCSLYQKYMKWVVEHCGLTELEFHDILKRVSG